MAPLDAKKMGKLGRERVIAEFSKEKMAERLENEFNAIPAQDGGSAKAILFVGGAIGAIVLGLVLTAFQQGLL